MRGAHPSPASIRCGRPLSLFFSTKGRDVDEALSLAQAEKKVRDDVYGASQNVPSPAGGYAALACVKAC
jgi:hypothetical protein